MTSSECKLVEIRPSVFGKGLFATQLVPENTVVCKVTGKELNFDETILLGDKESHCLQTGLHSYVLCDAPFLYSNHSCLPNCALNANLEFYTLVQINKDEELLWDYSTSMLERHWTMQCWCGSANCRKVIDDFDTLPYAIQQYYLALHIVLPFIRQAIEQKLAVGA